MYFFCKPGYGAIVIFARNVSGSRKVWYLKFSSPWINEAYNQWPENIVL